MIGQFGRPLTRLLIAATVVSVSIFAPASAGASVVVAPGGGRPDTSLNFELVGHNSLFGRGMNAALAIYDHFVYVGNRTDGSNSCGDLSASAAMLPVPTPTNP